jgi:hypothetical protein
MKLPGRAWLEFEVTGNQEQSTIRQTAIFDPLGLTGLAYTLHSRLAGGQRVVSRQA